MALAQDIREAVSGVRTVIIGVFVVGFIIGLLYLFAENVPFLNKTLGSILNQNQSFFNTIILVLLVVAVIIGASAGIKALQKAFGE